MNNNTSKREKLLYKPISNWLLEYLKNKNSQDEIEVYDIHKIYLSDFLERQRLIKAFSEYSTYKIKVDLLGIIKKNDKIELVFAEVKDTPLELRSVAQLLGYCKIAKPQQAFLISPKGFGKHLNDLINKFGRVDILEYYQNKKITIAKWEQSRNAIRFDTSIPSL
jgi:hypothetical protein